MSRENSRIARARGVYRRLLRWCYPSTFRRRVGASAEELFVDRYREASTRGWWSVTRLWLRTAGNVAWHGPLEGVTVWRERRPLEALGRELVAAWRCSRRSGRITATAIACIGLGVAATSAVLTLFSAVVIRPTPFPHAERLVRVWGSDDNVLRNGRVQLSMADVRDIEVRVTTLDRFAATVRSRAIFLGPTGARRVEGEAVTPGYFEMLGVEPLHGRLFTPDEYEQGSEAVMLLAHTTWVGEFGGDPGVVGTTVRTADRIYTVVGVLPAAFVGTIEEDFPDIEFWTTVAHDRTPAVHARRDIQTAWTVGRLAPGASLAVADREIAEVGQWLSRTYPDAWGPRGLRIEPFGESWRAELRTRNYLLLGAAALLLVVAAANVAGLLLARSLNRRQEFAVRAALGAGRASLVRQSMVESLLLAVVGGAIGVAAAPWVLSAFLNLAPTEVPMYVDLTIDAWALAAAVVCIGFAALIAGVLPASVAARVEPGTALQTGGRGTSGRIERRGGAGVIWAEVALTTMLVVTAASLLRAYQRLGDTEIGFSTERVLRMAVFVDRRDVATTEELLPFYDRLANTVRAVPGVVSAGLAAPTVPPGFGGEGRIRFAQLPPDEVEHGLAVYFHAVDPGFFPTLDIPIIAGRSLATTDGPESRPVAVVSASLAELLGGVGASVGTTIQRDSITYDVIGVAADVKYFGPVTRRPRDLDVYTSLPQDPWRTVSFAVQTAGDPAALIEPLRRALRELSPRSAVDWVDPMSVAIDGDFRGPRFYIVLVGAFATSALLLMAVGLFAVLAYQVAQRRGEFGIRQALGADRRHILAGVLRQGFGAVGGGLALGALGSLAVARTIDATLFGAQGIDTLAYAGTVVVVMTAAGAASLIPAARASRVSPLEALRGG